MAANLPWGFPAPTEAGIIEIKHYPEYRAVTYRHTGDAIAATRVAFQPLFEHISRNQIAMTTPVEARYLGDSSATNPENHTVEVSFLYGDPQMIPQWIHSEVTVRDYPAMTVVSIGIQGAYTWDSYQSNLQKLYAWLAENPEYKISGVPRRLLYNSPMTPESIKRSEVQIAIAPVSPASAMNQGSHPTDFSG